MAWITIILSLVSFLGPIIWKLIEQFLMKAAEEMPALQDGEPISEADLARVFDKAYKKTGYFQWLRQALIVIAKRACKGKASEIYYAAKAQQQMRPITMDEAADAVSETP